MSAKNQEEKPLVESQDQKAKTRNDKPQQPDNKPDLVKQIEKLKDIQKELERSRDKDRKKIGELSLRIGKLEAAQKKVETSQAEDQNKLQNLTTRIGRVSHQSEERHRVALDQLHRQEKEIRQVARSGRDTTADTRSLNNPTDNDRDNVMAQFRRLDDQLYHMTKQIEWNRKKADGDFEVVATSNKNWSDSHESAHASHVGHFGTIYPLLEENKAALDRLKGHFHAVRKDVLKNTSSRASIEARLVKVEERLHQMAAQLNEMAPGGKPGEIQEELQQLSDAAATQGKVLETLRKELEGDKAGVDEANGSDRTVSTAGSKRGGVPTPSRIPIRRKPESKKPA